jgi:hypothetical protein
MTMSLGWSAWALIGSCFQVELSADPALPEVWRSAAERVAAELSKEGSERCAAISLRVKSLQGREAMLEVESSDGRTARRRVASPGELRAVALGVLASIPTEASEPPAAEAAAIREDSAAAPAPKMELPPPWLGRIGRSAPSSLLSSPALVALTFGTRIGFPTRAVAPEIDLRADARLPRWLVSFSGRASLAGTRVGGADDTTPEESEYSVGALVGPWFNVGGGVLSFGAGPRLAAVIEATDATTRTRGDLWIELSGRYVFSVGERWHPTLAFEVDGAPRRMLASADSSGLAFPTWSTGIRFGIVGGVP